MKFHFIGIAFQRKYHLKLVLYLIAFLDLNYLIVLLLLDFLLPDIAHLDNIIVLPVLVLETFGFMFSSFLHFKQ